MNPRQSICLFFLITVVVCTLAGSSSGGTIKLRKLRSRSSDSSKVSAAAAASKQLSTESITSSASKQVTSFDVTRALIKTAKALARSHSTSEVLTLNLTNLLILVVLKAIIFGIGLFYFGGISFKGGHGGDGGHGWGRSLVEKNRPFMSQGELLLIMTYILGAAEKDNYDCMYRVACEDPKQAKDYLNASKMILKGVKYAKKFISYNPKYEDIVRGLQDAVAHKKNGGDCSARYVCSDVPNL